MFTILHSIAVIIFCLVFIVNVQVWQPYSKEDNIQVSKNYFRISLSIQGHYRTQKKISLSDQNFYQAKFDRFQLLHCSTRVTLLLTISCETKISM